MTAWMSTSPQQVPSMRRMFFHKPGPDRQWHKHSFPFQVCFSSRCLYWMHVTLWACITHRHHVFSVVKHFQSHFYSSAIGQIILTVTMKIYSIFLNFDFIWIILLHKISECTSKMQINPTWINVHHELKRWLVLLKVNWMASCKLNVSVNSVFKD